eukprot:462796_1
MASSNKRKLDSSNNNNHSPSRKKRKLSLCLQDVFHKQKQLKNEINILTQEKNKYKKERDYFYNQMNLYKNNLNKYKEINTQMMAIIQPTQSKKQSNSENDHKNTNTQHTNVSKIKQNNNKSITFKQNDTIQLINLQSKPNWNGQLAVIIGPYRQHKNRWPVELIVSKSKALIKPQNMKPHHTTNNNTNTNTNSEHEITFEAQTLITDNIRPTIMSDNQRPPVKSHNFRELSENLSHTFLKNFNQKKKKKKKMLKKKKKKRNILIHDLNIKIQKIKFEIK